MKQSHFRQSRMDACPLSLPDAGSPVSNDNLAAANSAPQPACEISVETSQVDLALACRLSDSVVLTTPQNYEPRYAYPLILWLTDSRSDSDATLHALRRLCPQNYLGAMVGGCTLSAGSVKTGTTSIVPYIQRLFDLEERLVQIVRDLRDVLNVHTERIFIAGTGSSATTAMQLALHQPDWFAGCISIGGRFPGAASLLPSAGGTDRCRFWLAADQHGEPSHQNDQALRATALRLLQTGEDVSVFAPEPPSGKFSPAVLRAIDQWLIDSILQNGVD